MKKRRGIRIESIIEVVLTAGLLVSSVLFVIGLALGSTSALRWGVLLLMFTPVARVVVLTAGLFRERDTTFALVSLFVLGVLVSSIVVSARLPRPPTSQPTSTTGPAR